MSAGYESTLSDINYLFDVASPDDRKRIAGLVGANVKEEFGKLRFFDVSGTEIARAEIHRRTQLDPKVQRSVYNLRMTYSHFGRNISSDSQENA
jgi:hypothetical protein